MIRKLCLIKDQWKMIQRLMQASRKNIQSFYHKHHRLWNL